MKMSKLTDFKYGISMEGLVIAVFLEETDRNISMEALQDDLFGDVELEAVEWTPPDNDCVWGEKLT